MTKTPTEKHAKAGKTNASLSQTAKREDNPERDNETDDEDQEELRALTWEEQEELVGELEPGDEGWLPLDEEGHVTGPAKKDKPPKGQLHKTIIYPAQPSHNLLLTPSGAPLVHRMIPDPMPAPMPGSDEEKPKDEQNRRDT